MSEKNIATPLSVDRGYSSVCIRDRDGAVIATADFKWTAKFLVRACNAYRHHLALLRDFIENTEVPDANCSCHISPPCSDCVEHSYTRELLKVARAALAESEAAC